LISAATSKNCWLVKERWTERLIGIDASADQLELASKRLKPNQLGGPLLTASSEN
jgi:hypothetical protein